ncbi:MAG: hypothetical protein DMF53_27660 [Acidobacteria bacterium]|nr:MAG: hypothetical protein DMF53_27660 [Acidobacteriota bacterium]
MSRKITLAALIALSLSTPLHAAAGDTVADRVLGQRRFSTAIPYYVDGTVLDVSDLAIDRSAEPNRVYVASPDLNRVLGWSDIGRFRAGAPADLVLGQPSVFNGVDIPSYLGCPVPSAGTFCQPTRVAVDPAGNLYVADLQNFRVLEFDRPFAFDRVADRVFGQASFTARRLPARLTDVMDVTVDLAGNLWMIDPRGTRRILEFDAPLSHDTQADRVIEPAPEGSCASGPQAPPCSPVRLTVDPQGNLYVQDQNPGGPFRELVFQRPLTTDLSPDFTLVPLEPFLLPRGTFDTAGGLIFVSDQHVWRYPPPIGPDTVPEIVSPQLSIPFDGRPALDSRGNLYVASYTSLIPFDDSFVYVVNAPFQAQVSRIGRQARTAQGLAGPDILAIDRSSSPNHLYVVDIYNGVLGWRNAERFANGAPADLVLGGTGCSGGSASRFCPDSVTSRGGLAVDSRGNLWMADVDNHNLGGLSARSLCHPGALAFDRQDRLYVADLANHRVLLFEHPLTDDSASKVFGQPGFTQGSCNQGRSRRAATLCLGGFVSESYPIFFGASSLAVDPQGNLYVADTLNDRVLIYRDPRTSGAAADVVIGQDGFHQALHGTGARRFARGLLAVAVGPAGELYVADPGNDRVLEFRNPLRDTAADRVFGHADFATGGGPYPNNHLPPPTAANLLSPSGVAVDAEGNLFVADTAYDRVLEYDRP